jgi:transcriptional antiterminator NusG
MDVAISSARDELAELAAQQATDRARSQADAGQSGDLRWYIVQCVGRSDIYVKEWLGKLKFETYYPLVREMRPVPKNRLSPSRRKAEMRIMRPQLVPFFPRYVLVRFDIQTQGWREIFKFVNVAGMHCAGDLPAPISDGLIDGLRTREVDGAVPGKTPSKLIFKLGEKVRVSEGPFASFYGTVEKLGDVPIEEIDPDTRIKVAVDIFGRSTLVELEVSQIEKSP